MRTNERNENGGRGASRVNESESGRANDDAARVESGRATVSGSGDASHVARCGATRTTTSDDVASGSGSVSANEIDAAASCASSDRTSRQWPRRCSASPAIRQSRRALWQCRAARADGL